MFLLLHSSWLYYINSIYIVYKILLLTQLKYQAREMSSLYSRICAMLCIHSTRQNSEKVGYWKETKSMPYWPTDYLISLIDFFQLSRWIPSEFSGNLSFNCWPRNTFYLYFRCIASLPLSPTAPHSLTLTDSLPSGRHIFWILMYAMHESWILLLFLAHVKQTNRVKMCKLARI